MANICPTYVHLLFDILDMKVSFYWYLMPSYVETNCGYTFQLPNVVPLPRMGILLNADLRFVS